MNAIVRTQEEKEIFKNRPGLRKRAMKATVLEDLLSRANEAGRKRSPTGPTSSEMATLRVIEQTR